MADGGSSTRNPHYFPGEAGSIRDPEVHRATLHYTLEHFWEPSFAGSTNPDLPLRAALQIAEEEASRDA